MELKSNNNNLYTIGHSQHSLSHFMKILKMNQINYIIDVRSIPYSKYASDYNKENIKKELNKNDIEYAFMGDYFGARPHDKNLYTEKGYLDFQKVTTSSKFIIGMNNVLKGIKTHNIALMCTEKDPIDCHRAIMVARAFSLNGINVFHILKDGKLESQQELNERLLNKYYSNRNQISLFSNDNDNIELLNQAYRLRNKDIGYYFM